MDDFDLKRALSAIKKRNDETREEWDAYQTEQRAKIANDDPKKQYALRAISIAEKKLTTVADDSPEMHFELDRMAEGYALLGNIEMAASVAHDYAKRKYYNDVMTAIGRDDDEICGCPKRVNGNDTWFLKEVIGQYSLYHCVTCGFENARC